MGELRFFKRVKGLFLNPETTMKEILVAPSIVDALLIVGIYALLFVIQVFVGLYHTRVIVGNNTINLAFMIQERLNYFFHFILIIVSWIFISFGLYGLTKLVGGQSISTDKLLSAIGYTYIYKIVGMLVSILLLAMLPIFTVQLSSTAANVIISGLKNNILFILGSLVVIIGVILSSYLGYFAVRDGAGVSSTSAKLIVGIPLLLWIIYTTYNFINM